MGRLRFITISLESVGPWLIITVKTYCITNGSVISCLLSHTLCLRSQNLLEMCSSGLSRLIIRDAQYLSLPINYQEIMGNINSSI